MRIRAFSICSRPYWENEFYLKSTVQPLLSQELSLKRVSPLSQTNQTISTRCGLTVRLLACIIIADRQ